MAKLTTLEGLDMSDNYVKYGAIAAGGILLYMLMQKQGLGDGRSLSSRDDRFPGMVFAESGMRYMLYELEWDDLSYDETEEDFYWIMDWEYENSQFYAHGILDYKGVDDVRIKLSESFDEKIKSNVDRNEILHAIEDMLIDLIEDNVEHNVALKKRYMSEKDKKTTYATNWKKKKK